MTIIVAFILEAFVFRMNFSRKNQDSEGLCREQEHWLSGGPLMGCLTAQLMYVAYLSGSLIPVDVQMFDDRHMLLISFLK